MDEFSVAIKFRVVGIELSKKFENKFGCKKEKLGRASGMIIKFLADNQDRDVYTKDIENILNVRRSTCAVALKKLENREYIKRVASESDARIKKIVLLKKGKQKLESIKEVHSSMEKELVKNLSKDEKKELTRLLDKIINGLKGEGNV